MGLASGLEFVRGSVHRCIDRITLIRRDDNLSLHSIAKNSRNYLSMNAPPSSKMSFCPNRAPLRCVRCQSL
jgi:hypothetical protein